MTMLAFIALIAVAAAETPATPEASSAPTVASDADTIWPGRKISPTSDVAPTELTHEEKRAAAEKVLGRLDEEERSWTSQLVRTLLSLLVVVGLIYLVFKVVVPKLLGVSLPTRTGKSIKVVERTQLDARHAVVLIEIDNHQRLLLATGERGVQLLADLGRPGGTPCAGRSDFQTALDRAAVDEDTHGNP